MGNLPAVCNSTSHHTKINPSNGGLFLFFAAGLFTIKIEVHHMKKIWLLGVAASLLAACGQEKTYGGRDAAPQIEVVNSAITPYEYDGGRTVTRVRAQVTNTGKPMDFYYAVQLDAEGITYIDSIPLYLEKGDTLRAEIIFTELRYQENVQPSMQHFIYPITQEEASEDATN
jgi:hypothetical protein